MIYNREFEFYHQKLLGREFEEFVDSLRFKPKSAIRVNTLKAGVERVEKVLYENRIEYARIPWCPEGLWVDLEPSSLVEHQLGFYYIQDAVSMAVSLALDPKPGEEVLDLCAAPGSKTTHLAALMQNEGCLLANEQDYRRIRALVYNIQRCGVSNAVITRQDGVKFDQFGVKFDKILLDVPCSDVGRAMSSRDVIRDWSKGKVIRLSALQKRLAVAAYNCLKEEGVLVYSTCTTSIEENEQVVEHILDSCKNARLERIKLSGLQSKKGLTDKTFDCLRILPHYNNTGGYFIAKIRKCAPFKNK
ncbi:MAG: RsmB/NOP family class I SAM-dependent RNA methyltransferase [Candidatus Altiarchaeales archaeon]|nr:RsmB/NOP family class I SAM-dependent RNA methyltransferase [Candidatus Altiarchaeales archaeon]